MLTSLVNMNAHASTYTGFQILAILHIEKNQTQKHLRFGKKKKKGEKVDKKKNKEVRCSEMYTPYIVISQFPKKIIWMLAS